MLFFLSYSLTYFINDKIKLLNKSVSGANLWYKIYSSNIRKMSRYIRRYKTVIGFRDDERNSFYGKFLLYQPAPYISEESSRLRP